MRHSVFAAFLLAYGITFPSWAASMPLSEGSEIELRGTTNVGAWTCESTTLTGRLSVAAPADDIERWVRTLSRLPAGPIDPGDVREAPVPSFNFSIPVRSLSCGNQRMEGDLREALRFARHRSIEFEMSGIRAGLAIGSGSQRRYEVEIMGDLSLAGVTREKRITLSVERRHGAWIADGTVRLMMSEFEVTPPVALFGLIRAHDQLETSFHLVFTSDDQ